MMPPIPAGPATALISSSERAAHGLEGFQGLLGVYDDDAIVNIHANEEAHANCVHHDAGRRRPGPIFFATDENTSSAAA